ncbi:hypothetical protein RQP46_001519 [Phenoliferia psychrophenolica]
MLPTLPLELTSEILRHATSDLVEQERHDSTLTGHTNALLLSAALVSHAWRSIAQPFLLRHGLVDPAKAELFIAELERVGFKDSLSAVRIGVPTGRSQLSDDEARASGSGLTAILKALSALRSLECVDQEIQILELEVTPNRIESLSFTASSHLHFQTLVMGIENVFSPVQLAIIDADLEATSDVRVTDDGGNSFFELTRMSKSVQSLEFSIKTQETAVMATALMMMIQPLIVLNALASCRLHFRDATMLGAVHTAVKERQFTHLDALDRLETHLLWLEVMAGRSTPNLTTVKILSDPVGLRPNRENYPKKQIMDLISNVATLKKLEVPDCWRSDEVEEACEAKGVDLMWT